ncbi:MAG: hypothetical protein ABR499_15550 [Gemmatimonadaceae bacterium]
MWRARIAALLGERLQAIALPRDALAAGVGFGITNLHRDATLESLRGFAPYDELRRPKD